LVLLFLVFSITSFSEELTLEVDVNTGETISTIIDTNKYSEATFQFELEKTKQHNKYPSGVNFIFSDKSQRLKILIGFLSSSAFDGNIVMGTELWVNGEQVINESSAIEEYEELSELTIYFNWSGTQLKSSINNQHNFELPSPPGISDFSFGIQSAKGKVEVSLPNNSH
jgi:hypothetical protein